MTKQQALKELRETKTLTTRMLKPLGVSFETFLKYSQLTKEKREEVIREVI